MIEKNCDNSKRLQWLKKNCDNGKRLLEIDCDD